MTNFRKRPLLAVTLGALFVGAISCGTGSTTGVLAGDGCSTYTTQATCPSTCSWSGSACAVKTTTPTTPTTPTEPTAAGSNQLSKQTDTITGTSGDDTFDASFIVELSALPSWNSGDSMDGLAGTDTVIAQLNASITPTSLKNIEILSIELPTTSASTVDLTNGDNGLTTLKYVNSAAALTVNNVPSSIANYELSSTGANILTVTVVNSLLTATTDVATIKLKGVGAAAHTIGPVTAASGYETFNIQSLGNVKNGAAGAVTLGDGVGNSLTTVNITGSADLGLTLSDGTVTKVNAGAVTTATATSPVQTALAGSLTFTAATGNGQNMTVTGGAGHDVINVAGFTTSDIIDGGAGTDTLVMTNADAIAVTSVSTAVTNTEVLRVSDPTNGTVITLTNLGLTGLQLGSTVDEGVVLATYTAGTGSFDRQDSTDAGNVATTLTMSGNASGTPGDTMNVTLGTTTAGSNWAGTGAFTINGAETVNITSQGTANTIGGALTVAPTSGTGTCTFTGNQSLTITGAVACGVQNYSGMTGSGAVTMVAGSGAVPSTITGTANGDTLIGGTGADTINGGGGNDTIQNSVSGANSPGNESITGGAGFDTIRIIGSSASAGNYTGSAFISDYVVGSTVATSDILTLDIDAASYGAGTGLVQGGSALAQTAAGAATTVVQSVAQSAAAAAIGTGADFIKLTTGVAFTTALQETFNAAIGSSTITGVTSASEMFGSFYDTTNSRMVVFMVDAGAGDTTIATADVVTLVLTIAMTATDYAAFGANHIAFVNY